MPTNDLLQAAIAAVHANAASVGETDWKRIVALYDALQRAEPSPVVALNRAAAVAMRDGPAQPLHHQLHVPVQAGRCRRTAHRAPPVVARYVPQFVAEYARRQWRMFPNVDRVYVNDKARAELGWQPRYDFGAAIRYLFAGEDHRSLLALAIGSKGYHSIDFAASLYRVP